MFLTGYMHANKNDKNPLDFSLIDKFYDYDPEMDTDDLFDFEEKIKKAYLVFIGTFCSSVSSYWKKYIQNFKGGNLKKEFGSNLTISDESWTMWLIRHHLDEVKEDFAKNLTVPSKREKEGNPHMTKQYMDDYNRLFAKIHQVRLKENKNDYTAFKLYESMFFDEFFLTNGPKTSFKKSGTSLPTQSSLYLQALEDTTTDLKEDKVTEDV